MNKNNVLTYFKNVNHPLAEKELVSNWKFWKPHINRMAKKKSKLHRLQFEEVYDLVVDSYLEVLTKKENKGKPEIAWIYNTLNNKIIDLHRKNERLKREGAKYKEGAKKGLSKFRHVSFDELQDEGRNPDLISNDPSGYTQSVYCDLLKVMSETLTKDQIEVLVLLSEGYKMIEVARRLKFTIDKVRHLNKSAKKKMQEKINSDGTHKHKTGA
jgi:RNA polymerase sigma factor (sigma-70 family)